MAEWTVDRYKTNLLANAAAKGSRNKRCCEAAEDFSSSCFEFIAFLHMTSLASNFGEKFKQGLF